ncbi:hypothetical protein VNO77_23609 [Canavalia gladiata]|uniref:Uncharacterized protein n=1 Tax=Canavalia gladiata TaxID=3824 RepID=A0AAN9L4Q4_CANGL
MIEQNRVIDSIYDEEEIEEVRKKLWEHKRVGMKYENGRVGSSIYYGVKGIVYYIRLACEIYVYYEHVAEEVEKADLEVVLKNVEEKTKDDITNKDRDKGKRSKCGGIVGGEECGVEVVDDDESSIGESVTTKYGGEAVDEGVVDEYRVLVTLSGIRQFLKESPLWEDSATEDIPFFVKTSILNFPEDLTPDQTAQEWCGVTTADSIMMS